MTAPMVIRIGTKRGLLRAIARIPARRAGVYFLVKVRLGYFWEKLAQCDLLSFCWGGDKFPFCDVKIRKGSL